MIKQLPGV